MSRSHRQRQRLRAFRLRVIAETFDGRMQAYVDRVHARLEAMPNEREVLDRLRTDYNRTAEQRMRQGMPLREAFDFTLTVSPDDFDAAYRYLSEMPFVPANMALDYAAGRIRFKGSYLIREPG